MPIVSTNVGGIPFLIEDGKDGVLVEKDDIKGMVEAIKNYIENPGKTSMIAKEARKKAERFDWEYVKKEWMKILS